MTSPTTDFGDTCDRRGADRHCMVADRQVCLERLALSASGREGMANR